MCWEPSVVELPLQPWMIGLQCSELNRSRSVQMFNQTLFQDAVWCAKVLPHLLVASVDSSNQCLACVIPADMSAISGSF